MELMMMDSIEEAKEKAAKMEETLCVQIGEYRFRVWPDGKTESMDLVPSSNGPEAAVSSLLDEAAGEVVCNFDGDLRQRWKLESLATSAKALKAEDLHGKTFTMKYYFMQKTVIMNGEDGELKDSIRTVLISPDNEVASFISEGVAKAVALIARRFGDKPLDPPLEVEVVETKTGKGRRFLSLVPAGMQVEK